MKKNMVDAFKSLSLVSHIGFTMALSILVSFFIGLYLDNHFLHTGGIVPVLFLLIGVGGGFYNVYQEIEGMLK